MKNVAFQTRIPADLLEQLDSLLIEKYAPMSSPSRNSVIVLAVRDLVVKLEAEKLSSGGQVQTGRGKKSATS